MPRITNITQQKKDQTRYNLYIDGKYQFSLSDLELATAGLRVGLELSQEQLEQLRNQSQTEGALAASYRYLSGRARSTKEVRDYLSRKGYEDELVEGIILQLTDQGYLNDTEFALAYSRDKLELGSNSLRAVRAGLMKKGIDRETIDAVLESYADRVNVEAVIKKVVGRYDSKEKLMRYLASKGFSYDDIKTALSSEQTD